MKVVVRVRPANEKESSSRSVVQVLDGQSLLFDPKEEIDEFYFQGTKQTFRDLGRKSNKELRFNFNNVFDEQSTNEEIYATTTAEIIDDLINGYNCAVFAYGPTGAGKTFTMLGNAGTPGITFMTMMGLYDLIKNKVDKAFEVAVTYIEIYNENLRDLLSTSNNLQIREDPRRGVMVAGISIHKPKTADELFAMLQRGNQSRSQHSTDANAESSRSHAVFTVYVTRIDRSVKVSGETRGKMSFIDLAGSERATAISKNKIPRLREGANINKSLLALGNCINALADTKNKNHVPYRDSKLTRLLKDSLGGNCKTIMIAAVSPSQLSYEDTYNTLKYADRAQSIKVNAKQNIRSTDNSVSHYIKLTKELQMEIDSLKAQLAAKMVPPAPVVVSLVAPDETRECNKEIRANFDNFCSEKLRLLTEQSKITMQLRDFEFRVCRKEWRRAYLRFISVDSQPVPDSTMLNLHHRFSTLHTKKDAIGQRIKDINEHMNNILKDSGISKDDLAWMHFKMSEIQNDNHKQQNSNLIRAVKEMDQNLCISSRLLDEVLPLFKRQYVLLKAHGNATRDVVEDYEKVTNMIRDYKDVSWADQFQEEAMDYSFNDSFISSDLKLESLANLDWRSTKQETEINAAEKLAKCARSLTYLTEREAVGSRTPPASGEDQLNSTFTKDEDSPLPSPIGLNSNAAAKVVSAPVKYPIFKLSSLTNLHSEAPKSPSLKRSAALSTCTNKLAPPLTAAEVEVKRRKLFSSVSSPQGKGQTENNRMKIKIAKRAHPYRSQTTRKARTENRSSHENNVESITSNLLPKQTITSMLRTKKVPTAERPRLFST